VAPRLHQFYAVAFEENLNLRQLAPAFADARLGPHVLFVPVEPEGGMYIYSFGAVVMHDVPPERRDAERARLRALLPKLTTQVIREDYSVSEDPAASTGVSGGVLHVDRFTPARASIVALTVAQSAAMEYYERIVENLFAGTNTQVERLQGKGTVALRLRPLHRFIGEAIATRAEVLQVLHLLDKPDETWDDPAMDRIYQDLRAEFDLVDRYAALESKLRSIQEALELVLDVARDRRLVLLEVIVALLILLELLLGVGQLMR
jgi:required for meiotic nuclear division protein 1